jgi:hypothetical protein
MTEMTDSSEDDDEAYVDRLVADGIREIQQTNQAAMAEQWGDDFVSMLADGCGFIPSPDGSLIGIEFLLRNGQTVRASLPVTWFYQIGLELQLAVETAAKRLSAHQETAKLPVWPVESGRRH